MGTGITDVIGGPHDFLPLRSDRSDEFKKNSGFTISCRLRGSFRFLGMGLHI